MATPEGHSCGARRELCNHSDQVHRRVLLAERGYARRGCSLGCGHRKPSAATRGAPPFGEERRRTIPFRARDGTVLIGERATPEMEREPQRLTEETEGVLGVTQILTMHLGPDFILLGMKVAFSPGSTLEQVEKVTDRIEQRIRQGVPEMKKIFIEPDSDGDRRGVAPRLQNAEINAPSK